MKKNRYMLLTKKNNKDKQKDNKDKNNDKDKGSDKYSLCDKNAGRIIFTNDGISMKS